MEHLKIHPIYSGNLTDATIFRVKAEFKNRGGLTTFYSVSNSVIRRYFFNSTFTVKCKNKKLRLFLKQNKVLNTIYDLSYESSEISPLIELEVRNRKVYVDINYQSFETDFNILDKILQFCLILKEFTKE